MSSLTKNYNYKGENEASIATIMFLLQGYIDKVLKLKIKKKIIFFIRQFYGYKSNRSIFVEETFFHSNYLSYFQNFQFYFFFGTFNSF